jgi:L-ascorbate metabolism protein UlaG (beta-lactamase superfamily)
MEIVYLGHSAFKIKGKEATVVTDPYDKYIGFLMMKTEAQVVTISHEHKDHNCLERVTGEPFVVRGPGEYEIKGISIFGIPTYHDGEEGEKRGKNTIYVIEVDGIRICHLGDLGHKLSDAVLEEVNGVDVLLVPVGGVFTIGPKTATSVVGQIQPSIVVPMHYKTPKHNKESFGKVAEVDKFLKEIGFEDAKKLDKLKIQGKEQISEEMEVIVLNFKG